MGCGASRGIRAHSAADDASTLSGALALAEAWKSGSTCSSPTDSIYGRVACLRPGSDPATTMIAHASRRVAFVADGLSWAGRNFRRGARDILLRNGCEVAWVDAELALGTQFKLVLFDDDGTVWPADWEGVQRAVLVYHPKAAAKIDKHWEAVRSKSWEELEAQAGGQAVENPEEMTEERYLAAEDTPAAARRFLATTLSLNKLFQGTGYTNDGRNEDGSASAEFFAANRPLSAVHPLQIIELVP